MCTQIRYNVYMKTKQIHIRASEEFLDMLEYLQTINGYKNLSDTARKVIEKEYKRQTSLQCQLCEHFRLEENNKYRCAYTGEELTLKDVLSSQGECPFKYR